MPDTTTHHQLEALIACHADLDHVKARIWQDGSGEPGTWNVEASDATITTAGQWGFYLGSPGSAASIDIVWPRAG